MDVGTSLCNFGDVEEKKACEVSQEVPLHRVPHGFWRRHSYLMDTGTLQDSIAVVFFQEIRTRLANDGAARKK